MKMPCPHCAERLYIRTSRAISLLTRELYMHCRNMDCAYTCRTLMSITKTVASSRQPNPKAYLPVEAESTSDDRLHYNTKQHAGYST